VESIEKKVEYNDDYYNNQHKNWFENPNFNLFNYIYRTVLIPAPAASVLDVGCGDGAFLRFLRNKSKDLKLTGVDRHPNQFADHINFITSDISDAKLDGTYDVVTNLAVIEHIWDVKDYLNNLKRMCKKGGVIVTMTVNERGLIYSLARIMYRVGMRSPMIRLYEKHHLNHFSSKSLQQLMKNSDLEVLDVYHHNMPIAAVDMPNTNVVMRNVQKISILFLFFIGKLTNLTLLQTIVCRKR
jgi:2-polyprenyl-3-methyl-5-hydroxy-6-metoxy-1,4-benzoquinol methylase